MREIAFSKSVALALACLAMSSTLSSCSDKATLASSTPKTTIDPTSNDLVVTADGRILWNRVVVTRDELSALLLATAKRVPEPELTLWPDANASYDLSAAVLERIDASGVTKFGFIGNEAHSASESSGN